MNTEDKLLAAILSMKETIDSNNTASQSRFNASDVVGARGIISGEKALQWGALVLMGVFMLGSWWTSNENKVNDPILKIKKINDELKQINTTLKELSSVVRTKSAEDTRIIDKLTRNSDESTKKLNDHIEHVSNMNLSLVELSTLVDGMSIRINNHADHHNNKK